MIRLPFAPLEQKLAYKLERRPTNDDICVHLGITSERTINKYRLAGLKWDVADRCAVALGFHPVEVWGIDIWINSFDDKELDRNPDIYVVKNGPPSEEY